MWLSHDCAKVLRNHKLIYCFSFHGVRLALVLKSGIVSGFWRVSEVFFRLWIPLSSHLLLTHKNSKLSKRGFLKLADKEGHSDAVEETPVHFLGSEAFMTSRSVKRSLAKTVPLKWRQRNVCHDHFKTLAALSTHRCSGHVFQGISIFTADSKVIWIRSKLKVSQLTNYVAEKSAIIVVV